MLYDRWLEIARESQNEIALVEFSSGRRFSFKELARASERFDGPQAAVRFPEGISADFVISVLQAWRLRQIVCPLERGQQAGVWKNLPKGCVHLKTTSASTGAARHIAFTCEQLAADARNIVATMGLRPDWPNLGVLSLAHSYGFSSLVLPLLLHGVPLVVVESPLPETVRRAANLVPDITLAAVPALWRAWFDSQSIPPNVRLAISAGAPLSLLLEEKIFRGFGLKLHNFYGASECGGIAYDGSSEPRRDASCVGSLMKNVQIDLDSEGCLRIRGAAVGQTYWPEPAANLGDGCYTTSDLGSLERDLVFLRGRMSDQINVAGRKVSPESIERVLGNHPHVLDCLVFGVPSSDQDRTETIVACVAAGGGTTPDLLRQFLLNVMPAWQVPREWWMVPRLESNQRGKIARAEWRNRYLERSRGVSSQGVESDGESRR